VNTLQSGISTMYSLQQVFIFLLLFLILILLPFHRLFVFFSLGQAVETNWLSMVFIKKTFLACRQPKWMRSMLNTTSA